VACGREITHRHRLARRGQAPADQRNDEQYCAHMATPRRTVSVEIDLGTVAIAELAAAYEGIPVGEWIAKAARRQFASINPGPDYRQLTETEMPAEDAQQAADEAAIAAAQAPHANAQFIAADPTPLC
jgi:hypothetical protein